MITIQHALGQWEVVVVDDTTHLPNDAKEWDPYGTGFKAQGLAIAYLKRRAKCWPDKVSKWYIAPTVYTSKKWYIYI